MDYINNMAIRRQCSFPKTDVLVYNGNYIADTSQFNLIDLQYMEELIGKDKCFIKTNINYIDYNRYKSELTVTVLEDILLSKRETNFYTKEEFFQACKKVYIVSQAYIDNKNVIAEKKRILISLINRSKTFNEFENLYIATFLVKDIIL